MTEKHPGHYWIDESGRRRISAGRCEFGGPDCEGTFMAEKCDGCGKVYCPKCDHYTECSALTDEERSRRLI